MRLEDQVCNLELSKRLKSLKIKQESFAYWHKSHNSTRLRLDRDDLGDDWVDNQITSAFTVAELGEMLPPDIASDQDACWMEMTEDGGETYWDNLNDGEGIEDPQIIRGGTEADMRAKMLIYLLEKNLMKSEEQK